MADGKQCWSTNFLLLPVIFVLVILELKTIIIDIIDKSFPNNLVLFLKLSIFSPSLNPRSVFTFCIGSCIRESICRGSIHRRVDSTQDHFIAGTFCHMVDSSQSNVNWKLEWNVKFFVWTDKTGFVLLSKLFRRRQASPES
jgi:hypothetical protein